MKTYSIETDTSEFCQYVANQKKHMSDWQFLHVIVEDPEGTVTIEEVQQFLNFHIKIDDANLLVIKSTNELLLFAHKKDALALSKFEKAVYENFSSDVLRARVRSLDVEGLEQFSKVIEPHIDASDVASYIAFKRMSRPGNCMLVLDDEPMVLKQLEKILSGFGHVEAFRESSDLDVSYIQYAPDVLFLDIHLGKAKGNELLKKLKKDLDPNAHVVMISSDTNQSMIMDIKEGGAKGFVVKPFDRNKLFKELMRAPTFAAKA